MTYSLDDIRRWTTETLISSKVRADNAASVAEALVAAEASGQGGHGLRRIPAYTAQARAGKVDGFATPVAETVRPGVLRIDAGLGFAYPALDLAVGKLPAMAREYGIAAASIFRSHHAGVMGLTVERLADQGLVALMVAHAPACMAPWGGRKPVFGTNPVAFAAPVIGEEPMVIDLALSKVARGKVMAARQKGEAIPDDWALDIDGQPTTDAARAMAGTMMPLGGAKGAALALMVETMATAMTGANFSTEASSLFDDKGPAPALGQMLIVIDPEATGGVRALSRIAALARTIEDEPGARLPGRRGQGLRAKALKEGIEIAPEVLAMIRPETAQA
ncbi:Ldh family oxidoreductase [Paenirhodobacter enshiensis]|uniref:Ldh family oxidoreductase n=1 Tax=Paenirhodobacter enshiensis TaxID=1105367 RepID=UPI000A56926E|nr:Ldh family oxidoreductase [Paenirhodobacter enshiensis]